MIAADIMTENPRTVLQTDSISEAVEVLQSLQIRHLPVLDEEGNLVGMLSDRDLGPLMRANTERAGADDLAVPLDRRRVCDLMSSDVVTVEPESDVSEIIEKMLEEHIGAVPVVDGEGSVVGIVSYVDVLRAIGGQGAEAPAAAPRTPSRSRRRSWPWSER